jgi:hypothetical protein
VLTLARLFTGIAQWLSAWSRWAQAVYYTARLKPGIVFGVLIAACWRCW